MAKSKIKFNNILLGILVAAFCFLRLYKATAWFSFNFDEEYQAFLAWSQVLNFHPIWIGVSASNFGFYLGPAFTYLNAFLFKLSGGALISLALFSPLLGIATCFSIYYTVSKIFTQKAAIFAMLIYGFSAILNIFDRRFWNPTPIPFISVWLIYSLYKANKDTRWFVLTSALMAISLHIHLSLVAFWPLIIFIVLKNIKNISLKSWLLSVFTYFLIISPMIVFDLNHNFDNLLGPVRYIFTTKETTATQTSVVSTNSPMIWRAMSRIWYIPSSVSIQDEMALGVHGNTSRGYNILSIFSLIILLWLYKKQSVNKKYSILFYSQISILLAYLFYPGSACEYFLLGFFALFPISAGLFFSSLPKKLSYVLISVFIITNSVSVLTINQTKYGLNTRIQLIKESMTIIRDKPFSVEIVGLPKTGYPQYAGWCFMYRIYGRLPVRCQASDSFGWILNETPNNASPMFKIIITEDFVYKSKETPIYTIQNGAFQGLIFLTP